MEKVNFVKGGNNGPSCWPNDSKHKSEGEKLNCGIKNFQKMKQQKMKQQNMKQQNMKQQNNKEDNRQMHKHRINK